MTPTDHDPERTGVVVVGCDGGADGDSALRFAAEEARLRGAKLLIVSAYNRPINPDGPDFDIPDVDLADRARAAVVTALRRALNPSSGHPSDHEVVTAEGDPASVLLDHAAGAALLVIGSHDRPLLRRLFGHVTGRRLLRSAQVPVAVVPHPPHDR